MSMSEVVRTALQVSGRRRLILPAPRFVMKLAAMFLQLAPGRPLTPDAIDFITGDAIGDPAEIREKLSVGVTPLRDGLAKYMAKS
jgi:hypothetical protein